MRTIALERLGLLRRDARTDQLRLSAPAMLALSVAGACLTALLAQVRAYLPGNPVPFTGQVLGVLICGAMLGGGYGLLSQSLYVGAGALGVPWFAMGAAGAAYFTGPTGGYLFGFLAAATFLGIATRRFELGRSYFGLVCLMSAAVAIIHFFGIAHLTLFLGRGVGAALGFDAIFIAADLGKALLAAGIVTALRR